MKTIIANKDMATQWETYVLEHPDTVAWQSYRWCDVLQKHYPVVFYPLAALDNDRICGILPIYYVHTSRKNGALVSVPFAVAGGIAADNAEAATMLLEELTRLRNRHGNCRATLKQYKVRVEGDLIVDTNYYNRELALQEDLARIFDGFEDTNRAAIERAKQQHFQLVFSAVDVDVFYDLLLNHHLRKGLPCPGKKWIWDLVASGMYSLALVIENGTAVTGTMVKRFKKTVSFPFTCAANASQETVAPYWLYWQLIEHFAREGVEIFHSGRIPNNDEADPYRLGWGGHAYSYYYQYMSEEAVRTEYAAKRGIRRNFGQNVWKHLPKPVAKVLGPQVVRRFP
ncbi:MAG: hypothetical protein IT367_00690 [Candidatus Hydrogenedentes bacterium]|nr:hypothetical protein [Candidatus Hydrogenedentota bacterium]